MTPSFSNSYIANASCANAVIFCNAFCGKPFSELNFYFSNFNLVKFCHSIIRAGNFFWKSATRAFVSTNLITPSFFNHVVRIRFCISKEKMVWIYTGRIVALVTNPFQLIKFSKMNHPRNPMGWRSKTEPFKLSITFFISMLCPFPAFSQMRNMWHYYSVFVNGTEELRNSFFNLDFIVRQRQSLFSRLVMCIHNSICRLSDGLVPVRKPLSFSTI